MKLHTEEPHPSLHAVLARPASEERFELMKSLLDSKADPDQYKEGVAPLHIAAGSGQQTMISLLHLYKAQVDLPDPYGCTPLFYAVLSPVHCEEVIKFLLVLNASTSHTNRSNQTPAQFALSQGKSELLALLETKPRDGQKKRKMASALAEHGLWPEPAKKPKLPLGNKELSALLTDASQHEASDPSLSLSLSLPEAEKDKLSALLPISPLSLHFSPSFPS